MMDNESLMKMKELVKIQGKAGSWDYDQYMHGMYNGMELMLSMAEGREPKFREAPEQWVRDKNITGEPTSDEAL